MRPGTFRPSRFIDRRIIALPIFPNMAAVCHLEFKKKIIFDHMTVIEVLIAVV